MEMALFFTMLGAVVGGMIAVAVWILGPLDRAAGNRRPDRQFSVADFLALVFLLQLPLGLIHASFSPSESGAVWGLDAIAALSVLSLWLKSVGVLTRAGVVRGWHRGVFLALVLPVAYAGATPAIALLAVLVHGTCVEPGALDGRQLGGLTAALVAIVGAILFSARFTRHIVAAATLEAATRASLRGGQARESPR